MESTGEWHREFSKINYMLDGRAKTATELIIRRQGRRNLSRRGQRENNRRDDIRDSTDCWCCNVLTVTVSVIDLLISSSAPTYTYTNIHPAMSLAPAFAPVPNFVQSCSFLAAQWVAFSNEVKCDVRPQITKYNHCASVPRFLLFFSTIYSIALTVTIFQYYRAEKDFLPQIIHAIVLSPDDLISFFFFFSFLTAEGHADCSPEAQESYQCQSG